MYKFTYLLTYLLITVNITVSKDINISTDAVRLLSQ